MSELRLPELGEGIETADVSAVLVGEGDFVHRDQPVIEVETEKASLEVPVDVDGQVLKLRVKAGDQIKVGEVILEIEPAQAGQAETSAPSRQSSAEAPAEAPPAEEATADAAVEREAREPADHAARDGVSAEAEAASSASAAEAPVVAFPALPVPERPRIGPTAPAAPSARALARELGVDVNQVRGSGPGGRISRDDVKAHAKRLIRERAPASGGVVQPPLPDFTKWGPIRREPLTNVRRATARAMANAWSAVPHVTQFDDADVTQLESMRRRFNERPEAAERKLTLTAIAVKMTAAVLRHYPRFNASLDLDGDAVVYKDYVHLGVAVDTERGLLVPVIRDVDRKSLVQVAVELNELASRARARKLQPDEMRGATFTVSNLGGLGTTWFSPIVNWPEVAILGVGRADQRAVFKDGQFQPRLMLPLSLSYDHRLIDGADAARFLRRLAEALEQPLLLLMDE